MAIRDPNPFGPTSFGDFRCGRCGNLLDGGTDQPVAAREAILDRDHWIRAFNRLEAAISHHKKADRFQDDNDLALYAARDRVLRDAAGTKR